MTIGVFCVVLISHDKLFVCAKIICGIYGIIAVIWAFWIYFWSLFGLEDFVRCFGVFVILLDECSLVLGF